MSLLKRLELDDYGIFSSLSWTWFLWVEFIFEIDI
jgi:hypothetical protein